MYRKDLVKANLEMLDLSSILNIKNFSEGKLTSLKFKKKKKNCKDLNMNLIHRGILRELQLL